MSNLKRALRLIKKSWNFIWKGDSLTSWILAFLVSYFIIKFIFFPIIEFSLHTDLPLVAVVSGSMEHRLNDQGIICGKRLLSYSDDFDSFWNACGSWYEERNITKEQFENFPLKDGFNKGDVMIIYNPGIENIKVGDVIVFDSLFLKYPVIHRVVNKTYINSTFFFDTKGDHNNGQNFDEHMITPSRIHGKAVFRIPYLGYPKIWLFEIYQKIKHR
ncbi:MAG: signal peptidase [Candidatus Woesearchaeota archaeon]|nr:signal peptidase [Candidatus Woesearchaeota archaeon]